MEARWSSHYFRYHYYFDVVFVLSPIGFYGYLRALVLLGFTLDFRIPPASPSTGYLVKDTRALSSSRYPPLAGSAIGAGIHTPSPWRLVASLRDLVVDGRNRPPTLPCIFYLVPTRSSTQLCQYNIKCMLSHLPPHRISSLPSSATLLYPEGRRHS